MIVAAGLGAAIAAQDMKAVLSPADNAYFLGGSVIFAYVFGSIYDDVDKRKHLPKPPPAEEKGE